MSIQAPLFSVVIATLGRQNELLRCLDGLSAQTYDRMEVVVVDNDPSQTTKPLALGIRDVVCVQEPVPGVSRARNRGFKSCAGELVAYIDDDGIPEADWVAELAAEFADPQVMAVAGRTLPLSLENDAEKLSAAARLSAHDRPDRLVLDRDNADWFPMAAFGGVGGGGNMAFRRSALESLGGFDESLGRGTPMYGGEEQVAFLRLVKNGFKVVYCPRAVIRHPLPRTMALLRGRYLKNLSASTAFFTKLFVELPSHRWDIAKYVFEALRKQPRPWRGGIAPAPPEFVSQFERVRALLAGPLCYAGVRLRQRS